MHGSSLHLRRIFRSLISAALVLLIVAFPAGRPVFAVCAPAPTAGNDVINCDGANDAINALAGNDQVNAGAGNDTITGAAGNDVLTGGTGNDTYAFNTNSALGTDTVTEAAAGGTDTLDFTGSTGAVTVNLNTVGNQAVNANLTVNLSAAEVENITGGSSNDTLTGNAFDNVLNGAAGNDTMTGGAGNDTLTGGAGNDTYLFNTNSALGTDTITEAAAGGTDTLDFTGSTNASTLNLNTVGNQVVNGNLTLNMTAAQLENVTGGSNDDILTGNALANVFIAGAGNDTMTGGAGNDTMTGGAGNDTYLFNTNSALGTDIVTEAAAGGTDILDFTGSTNAITVNLGTTGNQVVNGNLTLNMTTAQVENVTGGSNNDTLTGTALNNIFIGAAGNDTYAFNTSTALGTDTVTEAAGGGTDTLNFTGSTNAVTVDLNTVGNQVVNGNLTLNLTAAQVENVTGGSNDDTFTGNGLANVFSAGAGNDTMTGGAGNDTMTGGAGNDAYLFNTNSALGTDIVTEAAAGGTDTLDFTGSTSSVVVNLNTVGNQVVNGNLTLNMTAAQVENITGGTNNDTLTGNALDNIFIGGAGNDTMTGAAGNDTMTGGAGNDVLIGGTGNDTYAFNTNSALGTDTVTEAAAGGTDILDFTGSTNAIIVDLSTVGNQAVNANLTLNMTAAQIENVSGGSNNDTLTGNALNNVFSGGAGNDTYLFNTNSALGTDTVTEAAAGGTDTLNFSSSTNAITVNLGTTGNQVVNANLTLNMTAVQVENITGGSNNDTFTGNSLDNIFIGGAGNDTYVFNTNSVLGTDTVTEAAGGGTDILDFSGSTNAIAVNLGTTGNQAVNGNLTLNMTAAQVENINGGSNNDTLTGSTLNNVFNAGAGDDTMTGDAGNDTLTGGAGNDTYLFNTNTVLGTDTVTEAAVGGTDTLDFTGSTNAVSVDLGTTGNQVINGNLTLNMTAAQVENVTGGSNNDAFTGNSLDNIFIGGAGSDTYLFNTSSTLGTDTVTEAAGGGTDTLNFSSSTNAITVNLGTTGNQVVNGNLTLNMSAAQIENVTGGSNDDMLTGNPLDNVLVGGAGNDTYVFNTNSVLGTDTVTEAATGGTDTLDFTGSTNAISVDLGTTGNQVVNGNLTLNMSAAQIENINGGSSDDTLTGNALNNALVGGAGNDTYLFNTNSTLGTDTLTEAAGGGTDTLDFSGSTNAVTVNLNTVGDQVVNGNLTLNMTAAQIENVTGGSNNDTFTGNALDNIFNGGAGNDTYVINTNSAQGTDTVTEAAAGGTDTLDFAGSTNAVSVDLGTTGNQVVNGNLTLNMSAAQIENVTGGSNDDMLTGNPLDNVLVGGAGNDTYVFNTNSALGTDTVTEAASAGTDTLDLSNSTNAVTVDLNTVGNQVVNSNLTLNMTAAEIENVSGGSNDDILTGNSLDNAFDGGAGNDVLNGGDGNNTLNGGDGNDTLTGGAGNDTLTGGNDNDTYVFNTNTALGIDTINEMISGGTDTLDFSGSSNAITVDLGTTGNQVVNGNLTLNMSAAQVENVTGGSNDDTLTGNALNNVLSGGDGNDTLMTSPGVDTIDGGADDDLLIITGTHTAGDTVDGGTGNNIFRFISGTNGPIQLMSNGTDTLDFSVFGTAVTIDLSNSSQQDAGGGLLLTLSGFFDIVYGSIFDDHITGNNADNILNGGAGNDTLMGGAGSDTLNGGTGDDILDGGAGTDSLDGGADTDMVQNYSASDTHVNIENGFPAPATPPSTTGGSHSQYGLSSFIPVTGGSLTLLSCEANPAILRMQDNSLIFFYDLCGYSVLLDDSISDGMLAALPNDQTYLTGISLTLLNGTEVMSAIPHGVTAKLKISIPSDTAKTMTTLYWDVTADNGAGAWVEVPFVVTDGYATLQLDNSGGYILTVK